MTPEDRTLFHELLLVERDAMKSVIRAWRFDRRSDAVTFVRDKQKQLDRVNSALKRLALAVEFGDERPPPAYSKHFVAWLKCCIVGNRGKES